MKKSILFAVTGLLLFAGTISAQNAAPAVADSSNISLSSILIAVNVVLLLFVLFLLGTLTTAIQKLRSGDTDKVQLSWWDKFAALKSEKTEEELRLDEDFDGIHELDNPTPPWFNFIFYTSIIAAILYLLNYHVFKIGQLQDAEYTSEVTKAKAEVDAYLKNSGSLVDENNVQFIQDKKVLAEGQQLYAEKCAVCHLADGGGVVGPNLTDDYWLHGGHIQSIFKTIKYGVPAKGMIAWQNTFNGKQMEALASYVKSLHGTKPAVAKEAQGELYQEGGAAAPVADSTAATAMVEPK
ncbi:MAG: c-type cytochrome [Sphingobacteriales bacterium]|jgi:cytochrome c oxidase cbb3-type subunit 3|nr:c-type cytochrome [Sphingobacteriales bacterium]